MGENVKVTQRHSSAEALREQIRHTESDISETVHTLEERLSPRYLRRRGVRQAEHFLWRGAAKLLDLAQRTSVQASLVGGGAGGALWMLIRSRAQGRKTARLKADQRRRALAAARAVGGTGVWMLLRRTLARQEKAATKSAAAKPSVSGALLAVTAAKALLSGARSSKKSGSTRPGKKVAWRGLATAVGAALGSYWYSHRRHGA